MHPREYNWGQYATATGTKESVQREKELTIQADHEPEELCRQKHSVLPLRDGQGTIRECDLSMDGTGSIQLPSNSAILCLRCFSQAGFVQPCQEKEELF